MRFGDGSSAFDFGVVPALGRPKSRRMGRIAQCTSSFRRPNRLRLLVYQVIATVISDAIWRLAINCPLIAARGCSSGIELRSSTGVAGLYLCRISLPARVTVSR